MASKTDFEGFLAPETLDRTRTTESLVIGAILIHQQHDFDQLGIVRDAGVMPEDFSVQGLAKIYETMLKTAQNSYSCDFLCELVKDAHYKDESNQRYLYRIFDEGSSIRDESLRSLAKALKQLSLERKEIEIVYRIGMSLREGEDVESEYEALEAHRKIKSDYIKKSEDPGHLLKDYWDNINLRTNDDFNDDLKIKSLLPSLDERTQGFQRSEVSILAGLPGSGKSALALNFLIGAIKDSEVRTSVVSLEMSFQEIINRLVIQIAHDVPLKMIMDPSRLQPKKWRNQIQELDRIMDQLETSKKWINGAMTHKSLSVVAQDSFKPESVLKTVQSEASKGTEFIIVDHAHRVQFNSKSSFTEQMTHFMVSLTELSKSRNCHIMVLSQLNRESSKENRIPRLTDLKGSGGLEENCSLAMFLVREQNSNDSQLHIQKARSGESGWWIPMVFNPNIMVFGEQYQMEY